MYYVSGAGENLTHPVKNTDSDAIPVVADTT
jgi:hypothetical protein